MNADQKIFFVSLPAAIGLFWLIQQCDTKTKPTEEASHQNKTQFVWPAALEDGEQIASLERRTAKNYYVVFDGSGSMLDSRCSGNENKITVARRAVQEFAQSIPKDANIGLAVFDRSGLSERLPLAADNHEKFSEEISKVVADQGTPVRSAITLAASKLARQAARQMGYGEYHMVVVTDGEADKGQDPGSIVKTVLEQSPILMHTVGFCIGENHSLNQAGKVLYQSADSPEALRQGLKDVLAEATSFNVDEFQAQ